MRIDLRHSFNEGMNNLSTWRNRYSFHDYPEKVLINVFYRKYSMLFMWDEIQKCFNNGQLWSDFNTGFQKLKQTYQQTAISKTQPVLLQFLTESPEKQIGSTSFSSYTEKIAGSRQGNNQDLEEIEYSYLYYLLTDECVLLWAAFGGTGIDQIKAIGQLSGLIIETPEINSYEQIEGILGRLCASAYLNKVYNPLPPLK